jgi:hypothetical protein
MAEYKGIKGFKVQYLSADPSDPTIQNLSADPSNPIEGEMWYNSTSSVWKVEELTTAGSWATGGALSTARAWVASAGTQTAGLAGGGDASGPPYSGATEEYDGSTWSPGGNLGSPRGELGGCGIQTAALAIGGRAPSLLLTNATEEYDGIILVSWWKFINRKITCCRSRNTNCWFSYWWQYTSRC